MAVKIEELGLGMALPPLVKQIGQEQVNAFEKWAAWHDGINIHTDPAVARQSLGGFDQPIASGRMPVQYGLQALAGWFGREVADHSARIDLRLLVPVVSGDTLQVRGIVTYLRERDDGTTVNLEMWLDNQKGQKVAAGTASVRLASGVSS